MKKNFLYYLINYFPFKLWSISKLIDASEALLTIKFLYYGSALLKAIIYTFPTFNGVIKIPFLNFKHFPLFKENKNYFG